ncbi:MAG TPA: hypothetical protein VEF06_11230 [Bryobacteraceae bacterium]|nr:hypothetical protein [Bryobacteraceae bacterium]
MRSVSLRLALSALLLAASAFAQQQFTVDKLVQFITSSIRQKMSDAEVAKYLGSVRMSERLDPRVVEELQGKGAGSKTVAALNRLAEISASLAAPPAPAAGAPKPKPIPPPSYEEQNRILADVRDYALNYSKTLPDFISLQVTRRYGDHNFKPGTEGSWSPLDRVAEKLSYFDQHEKYELISQNDNAMFGKTFENLDGAISRGEFGTVMQQIFDPASDGEFHWLRWGTLRGELCHVFSFVIDQPHSKSTIDYNHGEARANPGYHGLVYVPKGTTTITRITVVQDVAPSFPLQDVTQTIDYAWTDISGQQFLLPWKSVVMMRHDRLADRNEIEFRGYRKYSADTSIKFDDVDDAATADDKNNQEQPATAAPAAPVH